MEIINDNTDWRGIRLKLEREARERRRSERTQSIQVKSRAVSSFSKMRKELAECDSISKSIKRVLRPKKELQSVDHGQYCILNSTLSIS